jgi:hypothetical protein
MQHRTGPGVTAGQAGTGSRTLVRYTATATAGVESEH